MTTPSDLREGERRARSVSGRWKLEPDDGTDLEGDLIPQTAYSSSKGSQRSKRSAAGGHMSRNEKARESRK